VAQDRVNMDDGYTLDSFIFDHLNLPELVFDYNNSIELFVDNVIGVLRDGNQIPFDGRKWGSVTDAVQTGSLEGLNPIQLMNVAWMVRLGKDVSDIDLEKNRFLGKRMSEIKLFETLVHHMYGYYEREVVPNVVNP